MATGPTRAPRQRPQRRPVPTAGGVCPAAPMLPRSPAPWHARLRPSGAGPPGASRRLKASSVCEHCGGCGGRACAFPWDRPVVMSTYRLYDIPTCRLFPSSRPGPGKPPHCRQSAGGWPGWMPCRATPEAWPQQTQAWVERRVARSPRQPSEAGPGADRPDARRRDATPGSPRVASGIRPMATHRPVDTPTCRYTPLTIHPRRPGPGSDHPTLVAVRVRLALPDPGSGTDLAAPCSRARLRHRTRSWIRRAHPDDLEPARGCRCLGPAWSMATGARACIPGPRSRLQKLAPREVPLRVGDEDVYANLVMSTRQTLDKLTCQSVDTPT